MSISKYIENYNKKREKRIKSNIEYANENPYPIDELNSLPEGSAFKSLFNENGEIKSVSGEVRQIAISENRDLFERLKKGSRGLDKLRQNEELSSKDPSAELNARYNAVITGISGSELSIKDLISRESGEFSDVYGQILDEANLYGIDADGSIVQAAFMELYEGEGPDETANPLNDEDFIDEVIDEAGPLNEGETTETEDDIISEVTETQPELETEAILSDEAIIDEVLNDRDAIDEERGFVDIEPVSPINEQATVGDFDTDGDGSITSNEYNENINSILNEIQENVANETSNIQNQITEAINNDDRSYLDETDINQSSSSITESIAGTSSGGGFFDDDMTGYSTADLELLNSMSGVNESENDSVSTDDVLNETLVSTDSPSLNDSITADEILSETEVVRESVGIDKSIAPINTPKEEPSQSAESTSKEEVTMTEVNTSTSGTDNTTTNTDKSTVSSETNNSENNNVGYTMVDMSKVEARLRKIENLLSGPLEVKIVE